MYTTHSKPRRAAMVAEATPLTCTRFSDNALLAHVFGEQGLTDGVVDLMCTGMVQVFTLEINFCAAEFTCPAFRQIQGAGATDVVFKVTVEFGLKGWVVFELFVGLFEFVDGFHQRFCDETPAVCAKMPGFVRHGIPVEFAEFHVTALLRRRS
jgi:hypothetical protein